MPDQSRDYLMELLKRGRTGQERLFDREIAANLDLKNLGITQDKVAERQQYRKEGRPVEDLRDRLDLAQPLGGPPPPQPSPDDGGGGGGASGSGLPAQKPKEKKFDTPDHIPPRLDPPGPSIIITPSGTKRGPAPVRREKEAAPSPQVRPIDLQQLADTLQKGRGARMEAAQPATAGNTLDLRALADTLQKGAERAVHRPISRFHAGRTDELAELLKPESPTPKPEPPRDRPRTRDHGRGM